MAKTLYRNPGQTAKRTMRQILFQYGPMAIPSYGLFIALGVIVAMACAESLARRHGLEPFLMLDTGIIAFIAGVVGTKAFFQVFANETLWLEDTAGEHGGHSFFAGMFSAMVAGLIFLKVRGKPILKVMDIFFVFLPLGHAIGRVGCLLYGCCYGKLCTASFPFALKFPPIRDAFNQLAGSPAFRDHLGKGLITDTSTYSLAVYPTQLFAILSGLIIFGILFFIFTHLLHLQALIC